MTSYVPPPDTKSSTPPSVPKDPKAPIKDPKTLTGVTTPKEIAPLLFHLIVVKLQLMFLEQSL